MVPFLFKVSRGAGSTQKEGAQALELNLGTMTSSSPRFFLQKMETAKTTCCENILDVPLTHSQSLKSMVSIAFVIIWGWASMDTPSLCESFEDQHYMTGIRSEVYSAHEHGTKKKPTDSCRSA